MQKALFVLLSQVEKDGDSLFPAAIGVSSLSFSQLLTFSRTFKAPYLVGNWRLARDRVLDALRILRSKAERSRSLRRHLSAGATTTLNASRYVLKPGIFCVRAGSHLAELRDIIGRETLFGVSVNKITRRYARTIRF